MDCIEADDSAASTTAGRPRRPARLVRAPELARRAAAFAIGIAHIGLRRRPSRVGRVRSEECARSDLTVTLVFVSDTYRVSSDLLEQEGRKRF